MWVNISDRPGSRWTTLLTIIQKVAEHRSLISEYLETTSTPQFSGISSLINLNLYEKSLLTRNKEKKCVISRQASPITITENPFPMGIRKPQSWREFAVPQHRDKTTCASLILDQFTDHHRRLLLTDCSKNCERFIFYYFIANNYCVTASIITIMIYYRVVLVWWLV